MAKTHHFEAKTASWCTISKTALTYFQEVPGDTRKQTGILLPSSCVGLTHRENGGRAAYDSYLLPETNG